MTIYRRWSLLAVWPTFCFFALPRIISSVPIDNALVGNDTKTECMSGKAVDLLFVLDGSGSIGDVTFEDQKRFVNTVIDRLDIGPDATRVAIIQYSDEPQLEMGFGAETDPAALKQAVSKVTYLSGTTRTGSALQLAHETVFSDRRPNTAMISVVITDGRAQDEVQPPSEILRSMGVITFAIGVTQFVNYPELLSIAGSAQRVFTLEDYRQLNQTFSAILTSQLCKTIFAGGASEIVCNSDSIGVRARTKQPFEGNVFVKGFFHSKACRVSADNFISNPTLVSITVPFSDCGVRRYRSLNPRGVFVETVVVFSFHPLFLTKVDQSIKIQCFYMEAQKTVATDLEVSMFTPSLIQQTVPMPICSYSLRKDQPNGPLVRYASIGESVIHQWECVQQNDNGDIFGMLVHSCFVDDNEGNRVSLLDSKGCGLDAHLLETPEYDAESQRLAYRETQVFKFADKPVLQFQCQITVCTKTDGGCNGITPPDCSSKQKRNALNVISEYESLDVLSDPITVFEDEANSGKLDDRSLVATSSRTCMAPMIFILFICGIVLFNVVFLVSCCYMRRRSAS